MYASSLPQSMQNLLRWVVGGLGVLLLLVVVFVIQGSPLQVPRVTRLATETTTWMEMLPTDVVSHMDRDVDPRDDFYALVKKVEIPEDESSVSLVISTLDDKNEKVLKDVMQQGWLFVGELYDSCMNSNSTNSTMVDDALLKVLSPVLEQIAATKSKKKLFRVAGVLHKAGTSFATELGVEVKARKRRVRVVCIAVWTVTVRSPVLFGPQDFDSIVTHYMLGWDRVQQHRKLHSDWLGNKRLHRFSYRWMILSQLLEGRMLLKNLTDQNAEVFVQMPDFCKRVEKLVTGDSVTLETLKSVLMYQFISAKVDFVSEPFIQAKLLHLCYRTVGGQKKPSM
ncbi:hypothetical protein DD238_007143 [Peronospora effusa]|uniref:Peptidase M13 N-terminal domain-containing protein n=1 Tax=Peronospora effusa TaxID=542832 RepID=A0A3M6VMP4_9STRA|nr:hypothetical protein DD238_007143 [Peronospora effusa]RQM18683.1 hypothetical protein DD237_007812 [Peronospora effusa]